ncbi:MAG: fasciclin domain-containing protein [Trueperaceae bacterium]
MTIKLRFFILAMSLCSLSACTTATGGPDDPGPLGFGFQSTTDAYEQGSIPDVDEYDYIFDRAVVKAGLVETLNDRNKEFTIFYPDLPYLEDELKKQGVSGEQFLNNPRLVIFAKSHIIEGHWLTLYDLWRANGQTFTTMAGTTVTVRTETIEGTPKIFINDIEVFSAEFSPDAPRPKSVGTGNGTRQVIEGLLVAP